MRTSLNLNGSWRFCPAFGYLIGDQRWTDSGYEITAQDENRPERGTDMGWNAPGYDDSGWMEHPVPASWNATFEDLWSYEGHGWYRRTIDVPADWKGRRVVFHSEAANYYTKVYVNGTFVGDHEGGYTPFDLEVQDVLNYGGENTIALSCDNEPKSDRCPGGQFDWWNHGGLWRDVSLVCTDTVYFDDVTVVTEVDEKTACDVDISIIAGSALGDTDTRTITASLVDQSGMAVDIGDQTVTLVDGTAKIAFRVDPANYWTPDEPYLYTLTLRMTGDGRPGDTWSERIGLRTFRVDGPRFLLNGKRFVVKGCNRYEDFANAPVGQTHNARATKTATEAHLMRDLDLVDWIGCNALRCHHPLSRRHYEMCAERGILNMVELPFYQWGRPLVLTADINAMPTAKQQMTEIIKTHKNNPSVFMWSVSNECLTKAAPTANEETIALAKQTADGNIELVKLAEKLDPTRPAVEISNCWPNDPVHQETQITAANVYAGTKSPYAKDIDYLAEQMHDRMDLLRDDVPGKPIVVTEFGAWTMYGMKTDYFPGEAFQAAQLKTMWEQSLKEENNIGSFIWVFADSDVHRRFLWVYEFRCAYGMFDIHRRPKEAAYAMRELWKPMKTMLE